MQEFMDLIFSKNDVLNVDLASVKPNDVMISKEEGQQLIEGIRRDTDLTKDEKIKN